MADTLLLKNVILYSNINATKGTDILIRGGKIISVKASGEIPEPENFINAAGLIAVPGLIDIHIHGAGGSDSLDGTGNALANISRTLAQVGTTSFLSTMVVNPGGKNQHLKAATECTGKYLGGAELLGIYIEGPFINIEKRGGIVPESIAAPSAGILDEILNETGDALKIMCVAPEIPGNERIIRQLRDAGIIAAFGHSDAGYEETRKGFSMGINHVTHLFNAMRPLHHREPGPLAAIFEEPGINTELIVDSHHVHPSLVRMAWKLRNKSEIACITDGISGMGLPEGTYTYNKKQYTSKDGLARYLDGTLIGSTMSLLNIVRNFIDFTGAGFKEAIDTVTVNPARILGIGNRKGSIQNGKDADIVLIDPSFDVQYTIIAGNTVYRKKN